MTRDDYYYGDDQPDYNLALPTSLPSMPSRSNVFGPASWPSSKLTEVPLTDVAPGTFGLPNPLAYSSDKPKLPIDYPANMLSDEELTMRELNKQNAPREWFPAIKEAVGKLRNGFASPTDVYNRLTGSGGQERYQTWPEQLVRSGFSLPGDVASGRVPVRDPLTGQTSQDVIERAQDLSGLMGGGSVAGVGREATLASSGKIKVGNKELPIEKTFDINGSPEYTIKDGDKHIANARLSTNGDYVVDLGVSPEYRRQGIASDLYNHIEEDLGVKLKPSPVYQTEAGNAFWKSRLSSDTSTNAPISALAKPVFYSALEHAVSNSKMPKADAEQWLGYLRNQPGVKQEELDFVLHDLPKGQISKSELEGFVQQHKVELKEVGKGGLTRDQTRPDEIAINQYKKEWDDNVLEVNQLRKELDDMKTGKIPGNMSSIHAQANRARINQLESERDILHDKMVGDTFERMGGAKEPTKYSQWQLPGGNNYREMLLTLPNEVGDTIARRMTAIEKELGAHHDVPEPRRTELRTEYSQLAAQSRERNDFQSSHWNEPNVLAHIRTNERAIPGVGNSLHVEEIQSDWHQKGRKEGYKLTDTEKKEFEKIDRKLVDSNDESILGNPEPTDAIKMAVGKGILNETEGRKWLAGYKSADNPDAIPNAPFKQSWPDLALKRVIAQAAREGKDAISWTPGEAQAARYDLSKHIDNLRYHKTVNGYYTIDALLKGRSEMTRLAEGVAAKDLPDHVGKEVTEKIVNGEGDKYPGAGTVLKNLDLKIGGEGMKAFYDKMLVDKANAIAKKFGGKVETNVGTVTKAGPEEIKRLGRNFYEAYDRRGGDPSFEDLSQQQQQVYYDRAKEKAYLADNSTPPMHVLRITPQLRDAALNKGFSLFTDTGKAGAPLAALSRVEHNPFTLGEMEKQHGVKIEPVAHNPFTTDAYHGTSGFRGTNIEEYRPNMMEFYSTPNPKLAEDYARFGSGSILPLKLDTSNYHVYDAKGETWHSANAFAIRDANQLDKPGVVIKNVVDNNGPDKGPQTVYITLDPSTVRSKFAKFDPAKFKESGLLKADAGKIGATLAALSKEWESNGVRNNIALQTDSVGGNIKLHDLVVPKENRNQGVGSQFMQELVNLADEAGKKVTLTAAKDYGSTSLDRLKKFYKQFGFVENKGRNKDFAISDNMYRDPKSSSGVNSILKASGVPFDISNQDGKDPLIDNTHDVPYGAGASKNGLVVHIDKSIPEHDAKTGDLDLHKPLALHERTEKALMETGMPYTHAHSIATKAEKGLVDALGGNWKEYSKVMDGYLKETEHENPKNPPNDLYLKPYPHDKQVLLEKHMTHSGEDINDMSGAKTAVAIGAAKAAEWLAFLGSRNYPKINGPLTAAWIAQWPMMQRMLKEDINRQLKEGKKPSEVTFEPGSIGDMFGAVSALNKRFGNKTLVPHEGDPFK